MPEFKKFSKIPRFYRTPQQELDGTPTLTLTEKIDGTNGCLAFSEEGELSAQSRNRVITPESDNQGFARWAYDHVGSLWEDLGPGYHYGEWFGKGINRGYGMTDKKFALFNVSRWSQDQEFTTPNLTVVPVVRELYEMDSSLVESIAMGLGLNGSLIAPGFSNPEGLIVFHHASGYLFKVPYEVKCKECRMSHTHKMSCSKGRVDNRVGKA